MLRRSSVDAARLHASYAALWAHLQKRHPRLRTILVTAASDRDDAATAASGLALAAARMRNDSAANDRNGSDRHAPALQMDDWTPGQGDLETPPATSGAGIDLETSAGAIPHPAGFVQIIEATPSGQSHATVSRVAADYGLTILVAPPPQASPECITLASAADAVVLVATRGRTRSRDARQAASLLRLADVEIAAAILLSKDGSRHREAIAQDAAVTEVRTGIPVADGPSTASGGRPRSTS